MTDPSVIKGVDAGELLNLQRALQKGDDVSGFFQQSPPALPAPDDEPETTRSTSLWDRVARAVIEESLKPQDGEPDIAAACERAGINFDIWLQLNREPDFRAHYEEIEGFGAPGAAGYIGVSATF